MEYTLPQTRHSEIELKLFNYLPILLFIIFVLSVFQNNNNIVYILILWSLHLLFKINVPSGVVYNIQIYN